MAAHWAALLVLLPPLIGLARHWLVLRFFRRVYEHGGAKDLKAAAEAVRRTRPWTADLQSRRRPGAAPPRPDPPPRGDRLPARRSVRKTRGVPPPGALERPSNRGDGNGE
ncbi:hypothetical protein KCV87_23850 [Actinosynnema pretiosum subsp. pretiosum]|uniref:Uncharacterized protein n=2 Tax=Actinosynnema TaxID=40566 RepID=C6WKH4_ACTMD|nr:hypothetical protein [Actinosynnema mirum]ACU40225.1 hypothetical protein Amir_6424 [Actinosynnema mirum DSM 43827]QUF02490.1 hypothetical protein KCV87_23850 [Actinosynnema pretiosum subsp. pretiosum]